MNVLHCHISPDTLQSCFMSFASDMIVVVSDMIIALMDLSVVT